MSLGMELYELLLLNKIIPITHEVFPKMRVTWGIPGILFKKKPVVEDPLWVKLQVCNPQDVLWSSEKVGDEASWRAVNYCSLSNKSSYRTSRIPWDFCFPFPVLPLFMRRGLQGLGSVPPLPPPSPDIQALAEWVLIKFKWTVSNFISWIFLFVCLVGSSFKSKKTVGGFMFSSEKRKHKISLDKQTNTNFRSTFHPEVI